MLNIKNDIEWIDFSSLGDINDCVNDLYGIFMGNSVDIIKNKNNSTWDVYFCDFRVSENFRTKDEAMKWAETNDLAVSLLYSIRH